MTYSDDYRLLNGLECPNDERGLGRMARLTVEERRRAAITAALRVIGTDGVEAATTRRVAAEAGMGQSSIFYAFESRDELLAAVVEHGVAEELASMAGWLDRLGEFTPADTPDPEGLIRAALTMFTESVIADPERQQALISLTLYARRTEGVGYLAERLYDGYYATGTRLLEEGSRIFGREWRVPPEVLTSTVIALTDGITLCWLGTASRERVATVIDSAVGVLLGYLG